MDETSRPSAVESSEDFFFSAEQWESFIPQQTGKLVRGLLSGFIN